MAKKPVINEDACVGCAACTSCPAFEIGDDGKAKVVGEADDASIDEAVASCPAGAISA